MLRGLGFVPNLHAVRISAFLNVSTFRGKFRTYPYVATWGLWLPVYYKSRLISSSTFSNGISNTAIAVGAVIATYLLVQSQTRLGEFVHTYVDICSLSLRVLPVYVAIVWQTTASKSACGNMIRARPTCR